MLRFTARNPKVLLRSKLFVYSVEEELAFFAV